MSLRPSLRIGQLNIKTTHHLYLTLMWLMARMPKQLVISLVGIKCDQELLWVTYVKISKLNFDEFSTII